LAKSVMNRNGTVMLGAGTRLTETYIRRLSQLGIRNVFIEEEKHSTSAKTAEVTVPIREKAHERSLPASRKSVADTLADLQDNPFIRQRMSVPMLGNRFLRAYQQLIRELAGHPYVMDRLTELHLKDPYLFEHAVNVSILSTIIGFAKQYPEPQLYDLAISSMLYDVGMLLLPEDLLTKKSRLSEDERLLVEAHTTEGYRMLADRPDIPTVAAICALQHHERYDGSGYPSGLAGGSIHEYAQIIAIADLYDALVSMRHHRSPHTPGNAFEYLLGSGDRAFDMSLVKLFIRHVSIYPVGSRVLLNSGQLGVVTSVDSSFAQRPIVKIIRERDGSPVPHPYEIDLKVQLELVVLDLAE
jgi:HD-GYP domain-containing protein (c-di-GMP phosphodiesterase class II)